MKSAALAATESVEGCLSGILHDLGIDAPGAGAPLPGQTFRSWCADLASKGLKVDGHPFTLDNRKALWAIYDLIPSTPEEAFGRMVVVQKGAQMGFTVWEMLADLYMALVFEPCTIGLYLPERNLASDKSTERFLPIVRTVPDAYRRLVNEEIEGKTKRKGEGNVLTRRLGGSRFLFLWTSSQLATESYPMDVVSFDEVQGMTPDDLSRTKERLSASRIRFTMALSTPRWPDADINFWFKLGTQHKFYTWCYKCSTPSVLTDAFPRCIRWDKKSEDYQYCCPTCEALIADTQDGEWTAAVPGADIQSYHISQILSPTITARDIMIAFNQAVTSEQKQNFHNRKLGTPYADPDQIPINMAILNQCVEDGRKAGVAWKSTAKGTFMGIDQMGAFNVVIIKERLADGRQATIHVEAIYNEDPFARCDVLMADYGVAVCVVETLPNYNDAKRFAGRHRGRVFLAHYQDLADDMLSWGDAVVTKADRKTNQEERDRYTVALAQYKCMQVSMARMVKRQCLFPDPNDLMQDVPEGGRIKKVPLLRDMVFLHFTKTALVLEKDKETRKYRPKVMKVGLDPHFSYANMLCDVAWARAHGTATFILPNAHAMQERPEKRQEALKQDMPGLPEGVLRLVQDRPVGEVCGACEAFDEKRKHCTERNLMVRATDPGCPIFVPKGT